MWLVRKRRKQKDEKTTMAYLVSNSMYGISWDLDILLGDHRAWRLFFRGHYVFMHSFRLPCLFSYSTPFYTVYHLICLVFLNLFYLLLAGGFTLGKGLWCVQLCSAFLLASVDASDMF